MLAEKTVRSRWVDAVTAMIALTQEGELQWNALSEAIIPGDDKVRTTAVFTATHNGKSLRLYEAVTETSSVHRLVASSMFGEVGKWRRDVVLEIVNSEGLALWTFPKTNALSDLLNAVQYQASGADLFLDEVLSEARVTGSSNRITPLTVAERSRKRGDALDAIIKVIDNDSLNEKDRLRKARALAIEVLLEPEF